MFFNRDSWNKPHNTLKGVNLGGWLVLEKWLTPSLFEGTDAVDEFNLHQKQSPEKITNHYKKFIKEDDFEFMVKNGINAVRIPVGHWLFGDYAPFPKTVEYLDYAFDLADTFKIKILVDLHTAPGSQNGYDHSGNVGSISWHTDLENIEGTLKTLELIAKRYGERDSLFGIELLNEPHITIKLSFLKNFYERGYKVIRQNAPENIAVVISDAFRPKAWSNFMVNSSYINMYLDMHFYQCFTESNKNITIDRYITDAHRNWTKVIKNIQNYHPVICGEWSLGIYPGLIEHLSGEEQKAIQTSFAQSQLDAFKNSYGWFFWTYKKEGRDGWNLRSCVEDDIINVTL